MAHKEHLLDQRGPPSCHIPRLEKSVERMGLVPALRLREDMCSHLIPRWQVCNGRQEIWVRSVSNEQSMTYPQCSWPVRMLPHVLRSGSSKLSITLKQLPISSSNSLPVYLIITWHACYSQTSVAVADVVATTYSPCPLSLPQSRTVDTSRYPTEVMIWVIAVVGVYRNMSFCGICRLRMMIRAIHLKCFVFLGIMRTIWIVWLFHMDSS